MLPGFKHRLLPEWGDLFDLHFALPCFHGEVNLEGVLQCLSPLCHQLLPERPH